MKNDLAAAGGVAAFVVLCVVAIWTSAPRIQGDLEARSAAAVLAENLPADRFRFSGRDAWIVESGDPDETRRLAQILQGVPGVRRVRMIESSGVSSPAAPPVAEITRTESALVVRGRVPDEGSRRALLDRVRSAVDRGTIEDSVEVAPSSRPPPTWDALPTILRVVDDGLTGWTLTMSGPEGFVSGAAADPTARARVEARLASAAAGVRMRSSLRVAPADPAGALQLALDDLMVGRRIDFAEGTTEITETGRRILDEIAPLLGQFSLVAVTIMAHSHGGGTADEDLALSRERATAVVDYLTSRGLASTRFNPVGVGSARPLADPSPAEGHRANSRIEFSVAGGG